jgi:hypothetical protein
MKKLSSDFDFKRVCDWQYIQLTSVAPAIDLNGHVRTMAQSHFPLPGQLKRIRYFKKCQMSVLMAHAYI